jgi:hypothetical protein
MDSRHPSRTVATTLLVMSLVAGLVACGPTSASPNGSARPASPGATASQSASAGEIPVGTAGAAVGGAIGELSPAPSVDVAALFTKAMRVPLTANASVEGEMTIGSATYPFEGESTIDGPDNHQTVTVSIPGAPERTETMTLDGIKYVNRGGLWFEDPKALGSGSGSDLSSVLKSVLDVTDAGVVTKGGESLHHLKPRQDAPIPISAIGMADPGGDGTATFDFYARSDGTLAALAMNATWTAVNGSARTPVRMTLVYTFSNVGDPVVIERPAQVWTTFTSKRFKYSIALPSDWEAEQSKGRKKPDVLLSADVAGVYVYRFPTYDASLNSVTSAYVDDLKRSKTKAKVTSNKPATVDGSRARRLEWTNVYKGTRSWNIDAVVVRGTYVYFFEYSSLEKTTKADRDLFDAFLNSVTLPGKGAVTTRSNPST